MDILPDNIGTQKGIAAVEFAIVLPLLLFLMLATAEVSRAFYQYNSLTKAVRSGARYLSTASSDTTGNINLDASDITATQNIVVFGNTTDTTGQPVLPSMNTSNVTVGSSNATGYVTVRATYVYQPMFGGEISIPGLSTIDLTGVTLNASLSMRAL